jgi:DNA-directed RNA polymerase specialized sigma24 family protein
MTGTPDSVRQLYVWDHARLWRALVAVSGSRRAADEAVVEVFAAALRRAPAGHDVTDPVWRSAFTIVREAVAGPDGAEAADADDPLRPVLARLAELGVDDRVLVAWRHVAGWTPAELAPTHRMSVRSMRRRLEVVDQRARAAGVFDHGELAQVFEQAEPPELWGEIVTLADDVAPTEPRRRWWRR